MSDINLVKVKDFAVRIAKKAGEMQMKQYGKPMKKEIKGDKSFVTDVDRKVQDYLVSEISKAYPEHSIVAEEGDTADASAEYIWFIDPIDGTHNYMCGIDLFGAMIALTRRGEPLVNVVCLPRLGKMCTAVRGKGAFVNDKPVKVSDTEDLSRSLVITQFWLRDINERKMDVISRFRGKVNSCRDYGASAFAYLAIMTGSVDAMMLAQSEPWDTVPGVLLVQEAGGKVTDFQGNPVIASEKKTDVVFSNGKLHGQLLDALR